MLNKYIVEFNMLDVGCGNKPKGDVNIDVSRSLLSAKKRANNFVVADAAFLPFKNEAFDVAFSAFTIEHVKDPFLALKEMCRVAKRKAIVRYFCKWGNGTSATNYTHFFDEKWLQNAASTLGFETMQFANMPDYPISERVLKFFPKNIQKISAWRVMRLFERRYRRIRKAPVETEAWIKKSRTPI